MMLRLSFLLFFASQLLIQTAVASQQRLSHVEKLDASQLAASDGAIGDNDDDDGVWSAVANEIPAHAPDFIMQVFLFTSEIDMKYFNQDLYNSIGYIVSDVIGVIPSWIHVSPITSVQLVDGKTKSRTQSPKASPPNLRGAMSSEIDDPKQSIFEVTVSMYMEDFDAYSDPVHLFSILSDLLNESIDDGYIAKVVNLYARNTAWENMKVYDVLTRMIGGQNEDETEEEK